MSLTGKTILERVKIRIGATDREYIAESVVAEREWVGKRRRLADKSNKIFTEGYHVSFTINGQDIEQVSGAAKDAIQLQLDLEDSDLTVLFFPDADDVQSFGVTAGSNVRGLLETEFGARVNADQVTMVTKTLLTKADMEWFIK